MQEKKKLAIEVDNVQKIYKLYDKPSDRMKAASEKRRSISFTMP